MSESKQPDKRHALRGVLQVDEFDGLPFVAFGASTDGSGVADDWVEIDAAIDALSGKDVVVISKGYYNVLANRSSRTAECIPEHMIRGVLRSPSTGGPASMEFVQYEYGSDIDDYDDAVLEMDGRDVAIISKEDYQSLVRGHYSDKWVLTLIESMIRHAGDSNARSAFYTSAVLLARRLQTFGNEEWAKRLVKAVDDSKLGKPTVDPSDFVTPSLNSTGDTSGQESVSNRLEISVPESE